MFQPREHVQASPSEQFSSPTDLRIAVPIARFAPRCHRPRHGYRGRLLQCLPLLALQLVAFHDAYGQCKPSVCNGDILVGEDVNNCYCMKKDNPKSSEIRAFGKQFCHAKQEVAADQNAIRHLDFTADTQRFEMFEAASEEQRTELQHKLYDALLD